LIDGQKIKRLREGAGMNQQELGNHIGASPQLIAFFENGKRTPNADMLAGIADTLGVKMDDLRKRESA
jgi:transcriptional regulator with XRE-family HTH domain